MTLAVGIARLHGLTEASRAEQSVHVGIQRPPWLVEIDLSGNIVRVFSKTHVGVHATYRS